MDLGVVPVAYPPIAKALCKIARGHVAPSYSALYPDGLRGQCVLTRKVAISVSNHICVGGNTLLIFTNRPHFVEIAG